MATNLYIVDYAAGLAAPSGAQIVAGQDVNGNAAAWAGNAAWTGTGQYLDASGLTPSTGYDSAAVLFDGASYSNVVEVAGTWSTAIAVLPAGIATGETFGTPALLFGGVSVAPTGIASVEAFGTAAVTPGAIAVAPTSIISEETFGTPVVTSGGTVISAEAVASAEAFGIATILPGGITLLPASIDSVGAVGTPTVSASVQLSLTQADIDAIAEAVFARFQLTPSDVNVVTVRGHAVPSGISTLL